jgi:hypothetical protein
MQVEIGGGGLGLGNHHANAAGFGTGGDSTCHFTIARKQFHSANSGSTQIEAKRRTVDAVNTPDVTQAAINSRYKALFLPFYRTEGEEKSGNEEQHWEGIFLIF